MKKSILTALLLLYFTVFSFANMGVIDLQSVFKGYREAQKMQTEFSNKEKAFKEKFEKRQAELQAITDEKKHSELSKKYREELEVEQKAILEFNKQSSTKIEANILNAVKKVSRAKALSYVLDKQAVLYGGFDITQDVLKELNK